MNIQELSVGDWIKTNDEDPRGSRECTIQNIEKWRNNYVLVVKFKDVSIDTLVWCCFDPIPLTTEILEKNGFELDKHSRWYILKFNDKKINVWIDRTGQGRIEISQPNVFDPEWYIKYANIECLNIAVHQLQHALRLAGIEKEIVL